MRGMNVQPLGKTPGELSGASLQGAKLRGRCGSSSSTSHPDLEPVFEKGKGMELMFTESRIMVAILLKLIKQEITALPMHDGLMVAASTMDQVKRVMGDVADEVVGFRLPVSVKEL